MKRRRGKQRQAGKPPAQPGPVDPQETHPRPLIFAELAAEYDGLPSPAGTVWGSPSIPPKGVARVSFPQFDTDS